MVGLAVISLGIESKSRIEKNVRRYFLPCGFQFFQDRMCVLFVHVSVHNSCFILIFLFFMEFVAIFEKV